MSDSPNTPFPASPAEATAAGEKVIPGDANEAMGNVVHDGVIRIGGDVLNNILISGKSGVVIMGSVYAGKIFSDGDITISGDICGRGEGTLIRTGKSLIVRSIINASVVAEKIICKGSIKNSRVHAYNIIEAMSGEGMVTAAQVHAGNSFVCNMLGVNGEKEAAIDVELADKNVILRNLFSLEEELREAHGELERLQRVVQVVKLMGDRVRELDPAKQAELKTTLERVVELQNLVRDLDTRHDDFASRMETIADRLESFPIEVRKRVLRGSVIKIDGATLELSESLLNGAGFFKRKRVQFKAF